MTDQANDQEKRNDEVVAALRSQFQPLVERLTPDIEPAPVYRPEERAAE